MVRLAVILGGALVIVSGVAVASGGVARPQWDHEALVCHEQWAKGSKDQSAVSACGPGAIAKVCPASAPYARLGLCTAW